MLKAADIPTPEWTTTWAHAEQWLMNDHKVFGRHSLTSHSGEGIELFEPETFLIPVVPIPLYTKHTKCKNEYRVHVMNHQVIDFVMKKKRNDITPDQEQFFNPYIRSHAFGWIFARSEVELPTCVMEAALGAIQALGLDFGAVDIGHKVNEDKAFVYEINTAPGIEGQTLVKYINAFKDNYLEII